MHGELENDLSLSLFLYLSLSFCLSSRSSKGMNDYEPVREQGDKRPRREIIGEFAS